jgi:small nuclear ribonucleoprotein B and B'
MNLVIGECEEFRRVKAKKGAKAAADEEDTEEEMKRVLGLVILRGETIVTLQVEGPPPAEETGPGIAAGPGVGAPAGRGMGLGAPTMSVRPSRRRDVPLTTSDPRRRMAAAPAMPPPGMPGMMPPGFMPPPPGFPGAPPPGFVFSSFL